ncbi:MAG: hypothetical protein ACRD8U_23520 [Pyrinomonadaceae bacterium]
MFSDDMIATSGSGQLRDKAAEINDAVPDHQNSDFILTHPFITENLRVRTRGSCNRFGKVGFQYKGQESHQERRYTRLYVKHRGRWRIVAQKFQSVCQEMNSL